MGQGDAPVSQCADKPRLGNAAGNDESKLYDQAGSVVENLNRVDFKTISWFVV